MTDIDLRAIYARYLAALNAREFERMSEFAHETLTFNGEVISRDDYTAEIKAHLDAVDEFAWNLEDIVVEGDRVSVRLRDTGTPVKEWLGLQPTGSRVEFTEFGVYRFREGRVEQMWYLLDFQAIERQLAAGAGTAASTSDRQDQRQGSSSAAGEAEFTAAEAEVLRYEPAELKAPNHNDVRSFVHAWFAAFDHAAEAEFFTTHLDDGDMTFTLDGDALAHDHASFRDWYADALRHIPWDFHSIIEIDIAGNHRTGWTLEFFFRHVGKWLDEPNTSTGRPFNRVLHATWRLEHTGSDFLIRRYDLTIAQNTMPI
ncbi:ester cyclase [Agreia sp.]|uniref:ester cyclase n=1 Tax=Agreia sp. TaxID=1872416 RepID=UPI0035BBA756